MTRLVRRDGNFDSDYFELVDRQLSRPSEPRVLRPESVRIEGRSDRHRHVVLRQRRGIRCGKARRTSTTTDGRRRSEFRTASFASRAIRCRRGDCRCAASSSATTSRTSGRGGGRRKRAVRRASGTSKGCAFRRRRAHLELLPYVVSKSSSVADAPGDPFNTHGRPTMRAGLDLKDRLTSNLTLDATFNPDFGQVEVDPAVLNLSAFETFFPEKRPFFIEGAQVFDFGGVELQLLQQHRGDERVLFAPHRPRADRRRPRDGRESRSPTCPTRRRSRRRQDHRPHVERIHDRPAGRGDRAGQRPRRDAGGRASDAGSRAARELFRRARQARFRRRESRRRRQSRAASRATSTRPSRRCSRVTPRCTATTSCIRGTQQMYSLQASASRHERVGRRARDPAATAVERAILPAPRPRRGVERIPHRIGSTRPRRRCAAPGAYARLAKETGDWFGELQTNTRTPGYETNDYAFQQRADYIWFNGEHRPQLDEADELVPADLHDRRRAGSNELRGRSHAAAVARVLVGDDAAVLERHACSTSTGRRSSTTRRCAAARR